MALKYRHGVGSAPTVVATSREAVVIIIINLTRTHGFRIHESRNLMKSLSTVGLYDVMPTYQYKAVADISTIIHKMNVHL